MLSAPTEYQFERKLRPANTALRRALKSLVGRSGRLLETGCGSGRFLRAIQRARPDLKLYGCDVSQALLSEAQAQSQNIHLLAATLTELPYRDGQFDIVTLFDVLEHVEDPLKSLREINRVLKPNGLFHALVPCEGQPLTLHWLMWKGNVLADLKKRHGGHIQRFTHREVQSLLAFHGFHLDALEYSMHPLGQIRDVLTYMERETWFQRWRLNNLLYRLLMKGLWVGAYVEAQLFAKLPLSATAVHLTAHKVSHPKG